MGLIDLLGLVAPGAAGRYLDRRERFQARRAYEAATATNYRPTRGGTNSGSASAAAGGEALRRLARHLEDNHDLAVGVLDDLVNNVVGAGARPAPMVRGASGELATDINRELLERWAEWAEAPDVSYGYGLTELERLVARSWLRDGEVFTKLVRSSAFPYRSDTRLALECLEADFCPYEEIPRGDNVQQGIVLNGWQQPVAYFFYDRHPGDTVGRLAQRVLTARRHDAASVLHLRFVRRLGQIRGVSIFHASMNRLRDVADYEDSERIAARVAADMTAYIKREAGGVVKTVEEGRQLTRMQSGMIFELLPGEDVGTISSDRPNTGLADFRSAMLRAVAAGTGTRYSSIDRNYNGTYSAQRQELVEATVGYRALHSMMVDRWYRPVWRSFLDATPLTSLAGIDQRTLARVEFRPPALPWIDPHKEAQAWRELIDARLESRAEIIRARGRDPMRVRDELEEEQADEVFSPPAPVMADAAGVAGGEADPQEPQQGAA